MAAWLAGRCEECEAPMERAQRYCTECGRRAGSRSPQLLSLLARRAPGRSLRPGAGARPTREAPGSLPGEAAGRAGGLAALAHSLAEAMATARLPTRRVAAVLVLGFLGFGVLVGRETTSTSRYLLDASARPPLKIVLAGGAAGSGASGSTATSSESAAESGGGAEGGGGEAPPAEATPTPAAKTGAGTKKSSPSTPQGSGSEPAAAPPSGLPAIKHVFLIVLSDQPYAATFGPSSSAPYIAQTLEKRGALLVRYYGVAHGELADEVALISGQGPTVETTADCATYTQITPATVGASGQVAGQGCVYPTTTETLAGQLTAKHLTWRAYLEGLGEAGSGAGACAHPLP